MGYTHYYTPSRDFTTEEWEALIPGIKMIFAFCEYSGLKIQFESDVEDPPLASDDAIRFNGAGDDGCETFLLLRSCGNRFNFCKTNSRPYDLAVCLCLLWTKSVVDKMITIRSDGDQADWQLARDKYREIFGGSPPAMFDGELRVTAITVTLLDDSGEGHENQDND